MSLLTRLLSKGMPGDSNVQVIEYALPVHDNLPGHGISSAGHPYTRIVRPCDWPAYLPLMRRQRPPLRFQEGYARRHGLTPARASYSARKPMTGFPLPHSAVNAVSIPVCFAGNRKSIPFQQISEAFGRQRFLVCQFRVVEDIIGSLDKFRFVGL